MEASTVAFVCLFDDQCIANGCDDQESVDTSWHCDRTIVCRAGADEMQVSYEKDGGVSLRTCWMLLECG